MAGRSVSLYLLCISALMLASVAAASGSYKHKCQRAARQCTSAGLEKVSCPDARSVEGIPSFVKELTECYETSDKRFVCYGTNGNGRSSSSSSVSSTSSTTSGGTSRSSSFSLVNGHPSGYMTECKNSGGSSGGASASSSYVGNTGDLGGIAQEILQAADIEW